MTDFLDLEREIGLEDDRHDADESAARSTAVVVAGMHRSGTSAIVRVLSLLGLDLPRNLYPTRPDNPLGYWEPLPVVEAHEEFLAAVGSSFDDFFALGDGVLRGSAARALEDKLVAILEQEYGASAQFVVKDPRICRLIPVWIAALTRFGAAPRFVLPVRHPLEVAASLKLRNEYGTTKSLLLWLRHVLEAEQHTRGLRRSVVSYEQLLRDWQGAVAKISHELGLVWPRSSHSAHAEIEQFLSPRRRHHSFAADELDARQDVVDWVKTTYAVLAAAADGERAEQDVLDAVRGELDRADRAFGPLLADLSLAQRRQKAALSEQAAKLDEATAIAERRAHDLEERTQALGDATSETDRLAVELADRQEALSAAVADGAAFREQVERLRAELADRERSADDARASVSRLTTELEGLQETVAARNAEAAAARESLEQLQSDVAEREHMLAGAHADVARLTSDLAERQDSLAAVTADAENFRKQIEQLQTELADGERALDDARAEVSNLATELAAQRDATAAAAARAEDSREQIEQLQSELAEREHAVEHALAETARVTDVLTEREEGLAAAAAEAATSREQIEQLQSQLDERERALEQARTEIPRLTAELAEREERLAAAAAEAAVTREQVERLRIELSEREAALLHAHAEVPRLTDALREREDRLAATAADAAISHKQVERLEADLVDRERTLTAARADVAQLTADLARRDDERADAEKTARELEERVLALVDVAAAQEKREGRAISEVAHLRVSLASRGERLAKVRAALDEARAQRGQLSRELQRRAEALAAAGAENDRLRAEDEALRAALAERESQLSRLDADKRDLQAAAGDLQREVEKKAQALSARDDEAQHAASLIAELRTKLADVEQSEARTRNELGDAKAALGLAHGDIDHLSRRVAEQEASLVKLQTRRYVRPRTRRRAASQLLSWVARPHRGGWRRVVDYLRLRRSGEFSTAAYLAENPDVDASGLDPLMHYLEHGASEGRVLAPAPTQPMLVTPAAVRPAEPRENLEPRAFDSAEPSREASEPAARLVAPNRRRPVPPPDPQPPADYGDFIVLLSRQRSGTNPLRSILGTHPDVFCFNEVFNLPDKEADDPFLRESNFFTFLERYGKDDIRRTMPDYHERLFLDYLEYLRCFSDKKYALIDVKYNTTHFLTPQWQQRATPFLLELIAKHNLYVVNVTRRNYLRYVLSTEKAWYSNRYTVVHGDADYVDEKLFLDPDYTLSELTRCREEDERIQQGLTARDRVLVYDYAEIFPGNGVVISEDFLERFADWRGISRNQFVVDPEYRKQSTRPLRETLENYDAVAKALSDSPFAYCLEDEPAYRPAEPSPRRLSRGSTARTSYSDSDRERWLRAIGSDPDSFVEGLCRTRPRWITGSLSEDDARFLFQQALKTNSDEGIEVGTASGFSTALLAHAFGFRSASGQASTEWRVRSYDILEHLYYDQDRRVGDAAREILPESVLAHVEFNAPATAVDVAQRHAAESISFLFIDANHTHPWPALDLLAVLDALRPGATVLLHDINLPLIHPEFPAWGVNHVFEGLELEKLVPDVALPNIGGVLVPDDREGLRDQLLAIVDGHPWEVDVPDDVVERVAPGHVRRSGR